MPSLGSRLATIERRDPHDDLRRARIERDASDFRSAMLRLAQAFEDGDSAIDAATQARWSPASRAAWAMRFAPGRLPAIIEEHIR